VDSCKFNLIKDEYAGTYFSDWGVLSCIMD
jgi:hypothetical protein